jgi:hypothetical protein
MKYVILSFDDGRKDNYEVAYPLLQKYGFTASMHIPTGFVDGSVNNPYWESMNIENVIELASNGIDISSHGDAHINEEIDLHNSLIKLCDWGLLSKDNIVFSSPGCYIYNGNIAQYLPMLLRNNVKYVRSGEQVRRNGIGYLFLFVLLMISKNKKLFYTLHKRSIMKINSLNRQREFEVKLIKAVCMKEYHTIGQLKYFFNKLKDDEVAVFMLHGIQNKKHDPYIFNAEKFEQFLKLLTQPDIKVINIKEYIQFNKNICLD